jgi:hypothetical protein
MLTSGLSLQVSLMAALRLSLTVLSAQDLTTCAVPRTVLVPNPANQEHLRLVVGLTTKLSNLLLTVFENKLKVFDNYKFSP